MHATDLRLADVERQLQTKRFGRSLEIREITDSTNDDARAAAQAGAADGHVVVAETQQHGRGARGRVWLSPPGTDLYLSIVARAPLTPAELAPLTLAVGLGVLDTVDAFLPARTAQAAIKWPNDVWVGGKKIAGILLESASQGDATLPVILGIGFNVNRRDFPDGLETAPTSLALERGAPLERAHVLATLLAKVEERFDAFVRQGKEHIVTALNQRLCLRDQPARCEDVEGIVRRVAPSGALVMEVDGVERELFAGTLRPRS